MNSIFRSIIRCLLEDVLMVRKYAHILHTFDDQLFIIFLTQVEAYYKTHPKATKIEHEDLRGFLTIAGLDSYILKELEYIYQVTDIDQEKVLDYINNKSLYSKLYNTITKQCSNNEYNIDILYKIIKEHNVDFGEDNDSESLSLAEQVSDRVGWDWPLESLNEMLGPVGPGDSGLIFARVETGKSGFVIHMNQHFLEQGAVVLDINTEDPAQRRLERYYINHFGEPKEHIYANIVSRSDTYSRLFSKRLKLYDIPKPRVQDLERLIKQNNPDIITIDQADSFAESREASAYEDTYAALRALAKEYGAALILVTQASGETGEYLGMDDIYGSRVGKPANVDYIVGIGCSDPSQIRRVLSFPKNKLRGLHGKKNVSYNQTLMRYEDV